MYSFNANNNFIFESLYRRQKFVRSRRHSKKIFQLSAISSIKALRHILYPSFPASFFFFNRPFYPIPYRVSRTRWHRANPSVIQFRNATSAGHFQAYWGWIVYPVAICFKPSFPYLSWSPSLRMEWRRGGALSFSSSLLFIVRYPRDYRPIRPPTNFGHHRSIRNEHADWFPAAGENLRARMINSQKA